MGNLQFLNGERDKYYSAHHVVSADWASATTALTVEPASNETIMISRLGFTVMDASADFTQNIKLDFWHNSSWQTRLLATNYASLAGVADKIESFKIGTKDAVSFLWHYKNGMILNGARGEKITIYPSANISNCDNFYCSLRYFKYQ